MSVMLIILIAFLRLSNDFSVIPICGVKNLNSRQEFQDIL